MVGPQLAALLWEVQETSGNGCRSQCLGGYFVPDPFLPLSTSCPPWGEEPPAAMKFHPTPWIYMTVDYILWNCEAKYIFPLLFLSVCGHSDTKESNTCIHPENKSILRIQVPLAKESHVSVSDFEGQCYHVPKKWRARKLTHGPTLSRSLLLQT
jgi:hypothetical protein